MSRLLLGALLLETLGITVQDPVSLAPPIEVRFDSVDYKNILRWTPPINCTSLHYSVQLKIYGEPQWLDVVGCQGIQKLQCDLSDVTSTSREWYYGRVHAFSLPSSKSAWALSPRFSPRWDTKLSPPVLRLNVTEEGIVVRVKPPKLHIRKMHSILQYKIFVIHPSGEEKIVMYCCFHKRTLKHLEPKAKYCLQAQTLVVPQAKSSARGSLKCVTTSR
uniref:Uncharacterized protein n=1 Tax=Mola mola TaxID=94237 RepID=A0A3Q3WMX6_MOLML